MSKQHTIKGYIVFETWDGEREGKFRFQEFKALTNCTGYTQVPVSEHTLICEIPDDFDPRAMQIAALEKAREQVRAEFARRITEIEAQINNLLAIENSPAAPVSIVEGAE
jgi:hypothetical protein